MDYNMPEMNGPEVVQLINLIYNSVTINGFKRPNIVCNTSETTEHNIRTALDSGMSEIYAKPFHMSVLNQVLS